MMIARWSCEAKFGMKGEALALLKEWQEQIGAQVGMEAKRLRTISGSVGAKEALIEDEFEIDDLTQLDEFFSKIAQVKMHANWGKKMSEVIVSGSTKWDVFRVI
ncbi:MAG: hypothetical protein AAF198_11650 [Pseudomonadota bacterium]